MVVPPRAWMGILAAHAAAVVAPLAATYPHLYQRPFAVPLPFPTMCTGAVPCEYP